MLAIYLKILSEDIIDVTSYRLYIRRLIITTGFGRKKQSSKIRGKHVKKTNISQTSLDLEKSICGDTEQVCVFI